MRCYNCGKEIPDLEELGKCPKCGAKVPKVPTAASLIGITCLVMAGVFLATAVYSLPNLDKPGGWTWIISFFGGSVFFLALYKVIELLEHIADREPD